jgi:hypothetical protein
MSTPTGKFRAEPKNPKDDPKPKREKSRKPKANNKPQEDPKADSEKDMASSPPNIFL